MNLFLIINQIITKYEFNSKYIVIISNKPNDAKYYINIFLKVIKFNH
jgi:hypothetical protein